MKKLPPVLRDMPRRKQNTIKIVTVLHSTQMFVNTAPDYPTVRSSREIKAITCAMIRRPCAWQNDGPLRRQMHSGINTGSDQGSKLPCLSMTGRPELSIYGSEVCLP